MKKTGYVVTLIAALVIVYNASYVPYQNRRTVNEHPFVTFFTRGGNLERSYPFTPPFTGFELTILGLGALGFALIIIGRLKEKRYEK